MANKKRNPGAGGSARGANVAIPEGSDAKHSRITAATQALHNAPGGMLEYFVVQHSEFYALTFADLRGPHARALLLAIAEFVKQCMEGGRPLCLDCDGEFSSAILPAAFLVTMPFASHSDALVSGMCAHCAARDDRDAMILKRLRQIWPDLQVMSGGSA